MSSIRNLGKMWREEGEASDCVVGVRELSLLSQFGGFKLVKCEWLRPVMEGRNERGRREMKEAASLRLGPATKAATWASGQRRRFRLAATIRYIYGFVAGVIESPEEE